MIFDITVLEPSRMWKSYPGGKQQLFQESGPTTSLQSKDSLFANSKNFDSTSSVTIVPNKNSKNCERIQWPSFSKE